MWHTAQEPTTCYPYSMTLCYVRTIEISWKYVTRRVMSHTRYWSERLDCTCTTMTLTQHNQVFTIAVSIYHALTFTEDTNWTNCFVFSFRKASMSLSNSFEGWLRRWHKSSQSLPRRVERCLNSEKSSISSLACTAWSKPSHTVRALGSGCTVQRAVAALMRTCRHRVRSGGGCGSTGHNHCSECEQHLPVLTASAYTAHSAKHHWSHTQYKKLHTVWNIGTGTMPKCTAFLIAEYNGLLL